MPVYGVNGTVIVTGKPVDHSVIPNNLGRDRLAARDRFTPRKVPSWLQKSRKPWLVFAVVWNPLVALDVSPPSLNKPRRSDNPQ